MAKNKEAGFDIWWNSPSVRRFVGVAYSLGASVVIIGAMFKILHLPGAGFILGLGMTVEALLFALGAFDKPHKEYEWDKIFDFKSEGEPVALNAGAAALRPSETADSYGRSMRRMDSLKDEDMVSLSEGIKNLSDTARQLNVLTDAIRPANDFAKNISEASRATDSYVKLQSLLNASTQKLASSYDEIGENVDTVVKNTRQYSDRIDGINRNLSSINSLYEIQLKNIQSHSEVLSAQSEHFRIVSSELAGLTENVHKIRTSTKNIAEETEKYKDGTTQLVKQIGALNQVYGNMLNSLS